MLWSISDLVHDTHFPEVTGTWVKYAHNLPYMLSTIIAPNYYEAGRKVNKAK